MIPLSLVTLIIFLSKARAAGSKVFLIKMPPLQWKKFKSDEITKGIYPVDLASVFSVLPELEKNWKKTEKSRKG